MGSGIEVHCKSCNHTENIFFGRGIFQDYLMLAKPKIRKQIENFRTNNIIKKMRYSLTLYYCAKCELPYNKFYIKMVSDIGAVYKPKYKCKSCKTKLELGYDSMIPDLKCPKCKEKKLEYFDSILWD